MEGRINPLYIQEKQNRCQKRDMSVTCIVRNHKVTQRKLLKHQKLIKYKKKENTKTQGTVWMGCVSHSLNKMPMYEMGKNKKLVAV